MTNTAAPTASNFDFDLYERVAITTRYGVFTGRWAGEVRVNGAHHVMLDSDDGWQQTFAAHLVSATRI